MKPFVTVAGFSAGDRATAAYVDGRQDVPAQVEASGEKAAVMLLPTPPRAMAIASISSMKPIAPPSLRAALRSALK